MTYKENITAILECYFTGFKKEIIDSACNRILEQEPKTGHWKVVSDGYGDNAYICECSECKDTVWVYKDADRKWNYCPSCGAKMVEPQESEKINCKSTKCENCINHNYCDFEHRKVRNKE